MKKKTSVPHRHEITKAGENIFEALGFSGQESAELLMRAQALAALARWRRESGLTQAAAAKILGVTQARVSDIERGKIGMFSLDILVRMAQSAGLKPELRLAA